MKHGVVLFSPFNWCHSLTQKYMTLNDPEILNGHFTVNFHYYEPRFSN